MEQKKKNKKLLIQISLLLIPVFIALIAAVSWVMYNSTVTGFLEAQNSSMETMLTTSFNNITNYDFGNDAVQEWAITEWEKDPGLPLSAVTDEEFDKYVGFCAHYNGIVGTEHFVQSLPPDLKRYYLKLKYSNIYESFISEVKNNNYHDLFLLDVDGENLGLVLCKYELEENGKRLGYRYDIDLSEHPAIEKLINEGSDTVEFERTEDFPEEGNYYIAYKPLILNDRIRAVLGIVYSWDGLKESMSTSMLKVRIIGIGGIVIAMILILILLYRRSIRPLSKIQNIVCDYTENKDSAEVISRISEIKARNEFGLLSDNISQLANAIDRYAREITELTAERERVAAELNMAKEIQAEQLPRNFPAFPDRKEFDIYASMTPAKEVGGDFYDFFFVDEDHLALVIADVSGKGVPAALFMMSSKMLINNFTSMGLKPAEVLKRTNEKLCENNDEKMFVTVWLGILEISTGKITAVNAGHEYPAVRQPDGRFELFKDKHGIIIGAFSEMKFKQYEFTLEKGGTLFVYTDGVPEATDSNEEMFGTGRMIEALNTAPDASPKELLENVRREVDRFVGEATQFDDLTMLAVKLF